MLNLTIMCSLSVAGPYDDVVALHGNSVDSHFRNDHVTIGTLEVSARAHEIGVAFAYLRLAIEEKIHVVAGKSGIERRGQLLARRCWCHQPRRDDDDEVGLFLQKGRTAE